MGYEKKIARAKRDKVPLHRPAAATLKSRLHKKLTQKQNWFKAKKKEEHDSQKKHKKKSNSVIDPSPATPIVSVLFIPQTPNSQLLQQM